MKKLLFIYTSLFFIGCSQNTPQIPIADEPIKAVSQDKEFDELDKIEAQMKDELSDSSNAIKQINLKVCK